MANAYDVAMWDTCKEKAHKSGFEIQLKGESFRLLNKPYGNFPTVEALYNFLCGYETGYIVGKYNLKD